MPNDKPKPIIIKKKVGGHGGHNGGAWKVAYADFVTAMMALFIVLWLMNSNAKVKEAVAGYFRDPAGTGKLAGTDKNGTDKTVVVGKDDMPKLKEQLEKALKTVPHFDQFKDQISITITSEGLRIELMETAKGMFFEMGSPKPTPEGLELLRRLAAELGTLPNRILIEGHTDATPYSGNGTYSNWELSCDRANQARQLMEASGLHPSQVFQVRGFADQQLRMPNKPDDPSNRRISLLVRYQNPPAGDAPGGKTEPSANQPAPPGNQPPPGKQPAATGKTATGKS